MGIEPGITNRTQTVEFLQKAELDRYCNYDKLDKISCTIEAVDIFFDPSNLVTEVYFQPSKSVTVGAVVEKQGPPDLVVIWEEVDSSPEDVNTAMYLCFDKLRACLRLAKEDGLIFTVSEDRGIEQAVYYSKLGYDLVRKNIIADFENTVLEWQGFVRY